MRPLVRTVLLVGCGLVAALEAPEAGAWLGEGLSGPYAPAQDAQRVAQAPIGVLRPHALPFGPVLFTLAPLPIALPAGLAVGR